MRRGAEVAHAGCEAFGAREEEVGWEGFLRGGGVAAGGGEGAGFEACGFGEGDEPFFGGERVGG